MNSIPAKHFLRRFRNETSTLRRWTSTLLAVEQNANTNVRRVTLDNPKRRNALSLSMITELRAAIRDDGQLRVIVLNASGAVFSSGHDLKELNNASKSERQHIFAECSKLMLDIRASPVPIIVQVNGLAAAAGCQLVAACDIALCTEASRFSTPGANVGLFCSTPGVAVSRSANLKAAAFMLLTGTAIDAQHAYSAGLVTKVAPDVTGLEHETEETVQAILAKSRAVIALGKRFFYEQLGRDLASAYTEAACTMVDNGEMDDCREGLAAFLAKRPPKWTHQ